MGRGKDANPRHQSTDETQFQPEEYQNHHEDSYDDENMNNPLSTRSYVPENMPIPEVYPPQKPATYPPQSEPVQFPPQPEPVQFPPQPVQFPPQPEPVQFPPQPEPVQFRPQTPVKIMGSSDGYAIGSQYLAPTQEWRSGLFDCANDSENAVITTCFPCITFGQIAEVVDNGQTTCATSGLIFGLIAIFTVMPCIMSCSYRTKIRNRYGLIETPAPDCLTHCLFLWCALCQEYRELKSRGLDPAIGWEGNLARNQQMQQQFSTMTPPMNQTMM